ncbi:hypothetical protein VKT23_012268 [Stygiomarasmius scandens]|uniref:Uncharacterized protein n=1 Tax=Marasmiellus scandens TaxID=2682957 RepID=A0ABR1JAI4_9AGAR
MFSMENSNVTHSGNLSPTWAYDYRNVLDPRILPALSVTTNDPTASSDDLVNSDYNSDDISRSFAGLYKNIVYASANTNTTYLNEHIGFSSRYFPLDNLIVKDFKVPAVVITASCRRLPQSQQINYNDTNQAWGIYTPLQNTTLNRLYPSLLRVALEDISSQEAIDRGGSTADVLIYGNVNVVDSSGAQGTTITLGHEVNPGAYPGYDIPIREPWSLYLDTNGGISYSWNNLQVMACSINASIYDVLVDGQSSLLIPSALDTDIKETINKSSSTWTDWNPQATTSNHRIDEDTTQNPVSLKEYRWWSSMAQEGSNFPSGQPSRPCNPNPVMTSAGSDLCTPTEFLNLMEWYINRQLHMNVYTGEAANKSRADPYSTVPLHSLETAIERASAAALWAGETFSEKWI